MKFTQGANGGHLASVVLGEVRDQVHNPDGSVNTTLRGAYPGDYGESCKVPQCFESRMETRAGHSFQVHEDYGKDGAGG